VSDDPYAHPGSPVLRNKLGITAAELLDASERRFVTQRATEGIRCGRAAFAAAAGGIKGDVNYVHPFREGNGRTQVYYLEQLAEQAGHRLDLSQLDPDRWIAASRAAHNDDYTPMGDEVERVLTL
jgi:cell filamentation protein